MRQRLVDAAESIVRDDGAAAVRLDSVGESVGLSRSSVYRYFDSKEELLTAVTVQATLRVGREVIDRIRVDQANLLRDDKPARKVVKRSRWLLLRNPENLKDGQAVQLQELLAANQPLATVYVLKDALKEVWYAPSVWEGWQRWRAWLRQARDSGLAPLQRFAKNLRRYLRGILASANFPMHTSLLEGVNNRIKVIKRMAYGFRDSAYFFLKIKAAFPGKAR